MTEENLQQENQDEEDGFNTGDEETENIMDDTMGEDKPAEKEQANEIDKNQIVLSVLKEMKNNLEKAINILGGENIKLPRVKVENANKGEAKIIEGVFAGDKMIGSDGESYNIPPNYASKSKLIEGDILKLTVTASGNFIYKQIGPIPRKRMMGELVADSERDEYWVASDTDKWKILKASATYFKGESGDKVSFLVPQDGASKWAAVENIIKENSEGL